AASKTGVEVGRFVFSDYGINYYSLGVIASDESMAKRPDMVRHMALATMQGYASAIKNPQAAADAFVKNYADTIKLIAQFQKVDPAITPDDVYASEFLPKVAVE